MDRVDIYSAVVHILVDVRARYARPHQRREPPVIHATFDHISRCARRVLRPRQQDRRPTLERHGEIRGRRGRDDTVDVRWRRRADLVLGDGAIAVAMLARQAIIQDLKLVRLWPRDDHPWPIRAFGPLDTDPWI